MLDSVSIFVASIPFETIAILLTGAGVLITAIAALRTANLTKKQIETSYKPELVLVGTQTEGRLSENNRGGGVYFERASISHNRSSTYPCDIFGEFTPCLKIANVGLGAAKKVSLRYSFPYQDLKANSSIDADEGTHKWSMQISESILSVKFDHRETAFLLKDNTSFDFILPLSSSGEMIDVLFPKPYLMIVLLRTLMPRCSNEDITNALPPLEASIEYFDIGGAKYCQTWNIHFRAFYAGKNAADETYTSFGGDFKVASQQRTVRAKSQL